MAARIACGSATSWSTCDPAWPAVPRRELLQEVACDRDGTQRDHRGPRPPANPCGAETAEGENDAKGKHRPECEATVIDRDLGGRCADRERGAGRRDNERPTGEERGEALDDD